MEGERLKLEIEAPMCLAIPGKVLETADSGWNRVAKVQFGGVTRQVYLDFVPEAGVGDYVLVHVGFAVSKVDEAEAQRTFELLEQMGALEEDGTAGPEACPTPIE
jgi:hydrogenase expression/formation protein HypC